MTDNILEIKKELKRVAKMRGLTRIQKYNMMIETSKKLSEKEKKLLMKEYKRDYESWDRVKDITELVTTFLTGVGLVVTVFGIFFGNKLTTFEQFKSILVMVGIVSVIAIMGISGIQSWRSNNLNRIQYFLDILEEKE
ncbi:MAG: hypothetical protein E7299_08140 [Lachnospiraceae bacterium]|nr:hypothetical protein [Lachnospiraceae bacterium]